MIRLPKPQRDQGGISEVKGMSAVSSRLPPLLRSTPRELARSLCTRFPRIHVFDHLSSKRVDLYTHRCEFDRRDFVVDFLRQEVQPRLELAMVLDQILARKSLVGEAHVHNRCRMPFGCREIYQPALTENHHSVTRSLKLVLLNKRSQLLLLLAQLSQRHQI